MRRGRGIQLIALSWLRLTLLMEPASVTVLIPAFNEGAAIGETVTRLKRANRGCAVFVIDDGSTDHTAEVARAAGATVLVHPYNIGYGAALKTGIRAASTPYVACYDGDGQHSPEDLSKLIEALEHYDMVVGCRDKASYNQISRRPGKKIISLVANLLSDKQIPDVNSGLRGFRRPVIARYLHLLPNGFSASTTSTIIMLKRGYRVGWVPITVQKRVGKSTVKQARHGLQTIMLIIRLITLFSPLRVFLPASFGCAAVGLGWGSYYVLRGHGLSVGALFLLISALIIFFFGILADQVAAMRSEKYE